jgi:ATP-dependent phosphofructokinase / diphosphate-dependent phosphofructokinase
MNIGVLTGGGDCPGLNNAIRAVFHRATSSGHTVLGIRDGWAGLATAGKPLTMPLDRARVDAANTVGGTILGSSRTNPMKREGGLEAVEANMKQLGLDALVAIGGDDTLSVAAALAARGDRVVGIPKTMDNDVWGTDFCLGFDTAATTAMDAVDRLQTTAASHHRAMVIEVMGRDAGWVAMYAGIGGGAAAIIIPEFGFDIDAICQRVAERQARGEASVVVVAEGVTPPGAATETGKVDAFGHPQLAKKGVAEALASEIEKQTGVETRWVVPGHILRGGPPSLVDRVLSTRYGVAAVELIEKGSYGRMVALRGGEIIDIPLTEVAGKNHRVDRAFYDMAARLS